MATKSETHAEAVVRAAGTELHVVKGGSGDPLLILHDEMGYPGWLRFQESLSGHHAIHMPLHPGFGRTPRQDWIMTMRDLAGWYLEAFDDMGLEKVNVIGLSLGGWLAAEMAAMCPHQFLKMVLVGAPGIRPPAGEIHDMFLRVARDYITDGFLDPAGAEEFPLVCPEDPTPEQMEEWEQAREQACRLTWRPYMFNPTLPQLLGRVKELPTLILWGREDPIVPLSVAEAYRQAIKGARLVVLNQCGHRPEIEKSQEFVRLVEQFLTASP